MAPSRSTLSSPWFRAVFALALLVWTIDLAVLRAGVPHPLDDTWEDGIVARELLQGGGLRTRMIYPVVWGLRDPATLTVPVLVHGPAMPFLFAPLLALLGPAALDQVAWLAAVFALLALFPLFRLASRLFGAPVAAAACGAYTLSPLLIDAVNHYSTMVVGAFLVTLALDLLARERPRALVGGLVAGAGYLVRPEMILAAPFLAILAAWPTRGSWIEPPSPAPRAPATAETGVSWRRALVFLLAFAAVASAWWWERWRTTGSPFFSLTSYLLLCFSPAHPGDGLVRDFAATPERMRVMLSEALPELWRKWAYTGPRMVRRVLLGSPGDGSGWLVVLGSLVLLGRPDLRRFAVVAIVLALIPAAAVLLLAPVRLYPVPFLGLDAIGAAIGARWLVGRLGGRAADGRWIAALVLLTLPFTVIELRNQARDARILERWIASDRAALAPLSRTPETALRPMFSDTPDFVAWTTGRATLWIERDEFERWYGPEARGERPADLPPMPPSEDTWFHTHDPRDPRGQRGAPYGR